MGSRWFVRSSHCQMSCCWKSHCWMLHCCISNSQFPYLEPSHRNVVSYTLFAPLHLLSCHHIVMSHRPLHHIIALSIALSRHLVRSCVTSLLPCRTTSHALFHCVIAPSTCCTASHTTFHCITTHPPHKSCRI